MKVHIQKKFWKSPTLMTLFSLGTKPLSFLLLLPLILTKFSSEVIALYYLLGTFISLQALADFGFYNTFVRFISFGLSGGCNEINDLTRIESVSRKIGLPNIALTGDIIGTMKKVYGILTAVVILLLIFLSPLLLKTINQIENPYEGWFSWVAIIIGSGFNFNGRKFSNFLLGQNKVALVRKWEGIFSLMAFISNLLVMYFYASIVLLIISNQFWLIVGFFRNRYLANSNNELRFSQFRDSKFNKDLFRITWPFAWKAGISSLGSQGTASASGIIYAQIGQAADVATYLFAVRVIMILRSFAQAPFYSKIPLLSSLRGKNEIQKWQSIAQRGMFLSNMIMVVGIIGFSVFGDFFLDAIGSNISFPGQLLWLSIGFAFMLHRYGGMHTQLYTTINKVNSHISDTVSAAIMILFWTFFHNRFGVIVFPIGMLIGYLGFYVWFAGYYSYKYIDISFYKFEIKANLIPFIIFFVYAIISILSRTS